MMLATKLFTAVEGRANVQSVARLACQLLDSSASPDESLRWQRHPLGSFGSAWGVGERSVLRIHYWNRCFCWEQHGLGVHDHTFGFTAAVVHGCVVNELFALADHGGSHVVFSTEYFDGGSRLAPAEGRFGLVSLSTTAYEAGAYYTMEAGVLHRTRLQSDAAITVLATRYLSSTRDGARVIGSSGTATADFHREALGDQSVEELMAQLRRKLEAAASGGIDAS